MLKGIGDRLVRVILNQLPEAIFFTLLTQQQTIDFFRDYFPEIQSTLVEWMVQRFPADYSLKESIKDAKSFDEMQPFISEIHSRYMAAIAQQGTASNPHLFFQMSNEEDTKDSLHLKNDSSGEATIAPPTQKYDTSDAATIVPPTHKTPIVNKSSFFAHTADASTQTDSEEKELDQDRKGMGNG